MPRLTRERVEEILLGILESNNDVTILTPLLQELRDDYGNIDILLEQSTIKVKEQETQLSNLKQKYYDTFVGTPNNKEDEVPNNEDNEELRNDVKSFDDLILEIQ